MCRQQPRKGEKVLGRQLLAQNRSATPRKYTTPNLSKDSFRSTIHRTESRKSQEKHHLSSVSSSLVLLFYSFKLFSVEQLSQISLKNLKYFNLRAIGI